jgi:hypothetical protein
MGHKVPCPAFDAKVGARALATLSCQAGVLE